jgi:hypothetical protein
MSAFASESNVGILETRDDGKCLIVENEDREKVGVARAECGL